MIPNRRSAESDKWRALLKEYRTRMGVTQTEMAKLLGLSSSAVCQWEAGNVHMEVRYATGPMKKVLGWLESYDAFVAGVQNARGVKVLLVGGQHPPVRPKFIDGLRKMGLPVEHTLDVDTTRNPGAFPAGITLVVLIQPSCPARYAELLHHQGRARNIPVVSVPDQWSQAQKVLLARRHGHVPLDEVGSDEIPPYPANGWVRQDDLGGMFRHFGLSLEEVLKRLASPPSLFRHPSSPDPINAWPISRVQALLEVLYMDQELLDQERADQEPPPDELPPPVGPDLSQDNIELALHPPMPVMFREAPVAQPTRPEPRVEVSFVETIDQTVRSLQGVADQIDETKALHTHLEQWAAGRVGRAVLEATRAVTARAEQAELELEMMRDLLDAARQHNRKLEDMLAALELRRR